MSRLALILLLALLLAGCGGSASDSAAPSASAESGSTTAETSGDEPAGYETTTAPEFPVVTIDASNGEQVEVRVEIADNPLGRYFGLRERENLPEDRGMLFVYTDEEELAFTMDDTLIPLSIAFMDSQGRIVDIQDMKPLTKGPYVSAEPAQYALEVNRGFFDERGVEVGDRAELPG